MTTSGPVLFARYAFGPNRLGLCGPDDWRSLLGLGSSGEDDRGLRELARGFEGAYPYLELLAGGAGIADPLDARVVEGYWLGTGLASSVTPVAMARSMETRFRGRLDADEWRWLAGKPASGARPIHAFHVLDVFPRLGLLRGATAPDTLTVMDACRIRWGRVLEVADDRLVVSTPRLELAAGRLELAPPRVETVQRWLDGTGFIDDVRPGDVVSIHWDWACDKLTQDQLRSLVTSTRAQIDVTNLTL